MNLSMRDIISLAMSKNTGGKRARYLIKGMIFLPFIALGAKVFRRDDELTKKIEAGEDIYPLF